MEIRTTYKLELLAGENGLGWVEHTGYSIDVEQLREEGQMWTRSEPRNPKEKFAYLITIPGVELDD